MANMALEIALGKLSITRLMLLNGKMSVEQAAKSLDMIIKEIREAVEELAKD